MRTLTSTISMALQDMDTIREIIGEEKRLGERFRTRAVDIPQNIVATGLLPTLTFAYAKASKGSYEKVKRAFHEARKLGGIKEDEFGYAAHLFLTLKHIREGGFLEDIEDPLECFIALSRLPTEKLILLKARLTLYLLEIKKLSEALFQKEEG